MEWLKKINNAIDYIENNLDSEISYDYFLLGTL